MQDKFITEALERYTHYIACLDSLESGDDTPVRELIAHTKADPTPRPRGGPYTLKLVSDYLDAPDRRRAITALKGVIGDNFRTEAKYIRYAVLKSLPAHAKALLQEASEFSKATEDVQKMESILGDPTCRALTEPQTLRTIKRQYREARRVMFRIWRLTLAEILQAEREDSDYLGI